MSHPAPPARSPHPAPDGPPHTHQALVTGIGITAPNGLGAPAYWDALLSGRSGLGPITRFDASGYPVRIAGEITDFATRNTSQQTPASTAAPASPWPRPRKPSTTRGAGPQETAGNQAGVMTASLAGGAEFGQRGLAALWSKGATHVSAYQSFASFHAAAPAQISIRHRLRGHGSAIITEQAGGIDALARARRRIRDGAPLMVTGGVDSTLCPWGWAAHLADGRLSPSGEPHHAYRPFAATADGHTVGEGGALLVLEDARSAARRGATGYGTVAGAPPPSTAPRRPRLRERAELALAQAGLTPAHVDVVFADGAGRRAPTAPRAPHCAPCSAPYGVPVTVPKTMTGRLGAGGAALDVATALLALNAKTVPPTTGTTRVAGDCPLDLVTAPRRLPHLQVALVLAADEAASTAATVLRAPHPG
uniref:Putative polyketide synthase n=1 Tax=Streptomyces ambofaciens TaxID=1889 RepID=Q9KWX1_STRAM|nr:putative polyketide synthase [Streptomyces ambofaciens]